MSKTVFQSAHYFKTFKVEVLEVGWLIEVSSWNLSWIGVIVEYEKPSSKERTFVMNHVLLQHS